METPEPDDVAGSSTFSFGDVVIMVDSYEVSRGGEHVAIEPQVFEVLCYLIEHRDRVVGKLELYDNVWGDRFVSESALTSRIKSARRAVGDDGRRQEIIRTTHGRGYRFVADVIQTTNEVEAKSAAETAQHAADTTQALAARSSVPAPTRPLVARDRELAALFELLSANRLVTVTGPGGVGKTRVATEVATRWDHDFDDMVTYASLATVSDPDQVIVAMRDALGMRAGSADAFGAVRENLAGKSTLLVLDNFEHVVESAPMLGDLVESVPGVRMLLTSRERLGLAGEQVLELEPLALTSDDPAEIAPAMVFFEHAVRGVGSDVPFDADNREAAAAICQTLDGLPLAIELAAAQTRYFPLQYLRTHLESQAMMVADHARDRPDRHQTMGATISWSYGLLTPSQQNLLAALSVYRTAWPFGAAETFAADGINSGASDLLALVDKSLVQRTDGALGEPRFSMLRLLREFAGAQLDAADRRGDALDHHAEFIGETVRSLEARRWTAGGDGWIDAIGSEYADVVAALEWSFGRGDPAVGCRIVAALGFWWYRSGRHGEGRAWVDQALASASEVDDPTTAWIHAASGSLAKYELRSDKAREHFETTLRIARETGDERLEALALCDSGVVAAGDSEHYESGMETVQLGLALARRIESPQIVAHGLTVLGELTRANGHPEAAEAAYREALDLNVQIGDRYYEAVNVLNMGHALMAQERTHEALSYHRRGIELASRIGSRIMVAWNVSEFAAAHRLLGQPELAAQLIGAAEAALEVLGATYGPVDQPMHDRTQQAIRKELGDATYDRLVTDGRKMTLEEAVALALDALDALDRQAS